ncbi:tetratricopeptide repeat protein [Streptomyces sp. NPDC048275]|uniref:tetratricopeptide repeat protein n=1 Tax=Streptomyces sp. NPDC048275 TaxID=3155629 RepID=UPI0033FBDA6E
MSRLSREELERQRSAAASGVPPIEVLVPVTAEGAAGGATVGGMPVAAAPGEAVQDAVLNHLHHVALATGRPVLATIHDERIGFVVPLEVCVDGSSRYAGEPVRVTEVPVPSGPAQSGPAPSTHAHRAVPEPKPLPGAAATHAPRAVPEPEAARGAATGAMTPPPEELGPVPERPVPAMEAPAVMETEREPKPTPARGFDAVAESVLAPAPGEAGAATEGAAFLGGPVAQINEAVRKGRIEEAAGLAERAVAEASRSLGPEHPEVLRLRELTAYIAYLAGDALRSFQLSLDLAQVRRRHQDADAAYGSVQSAYTAWRAVRDPSQGLHLGRDLIGLWTELVADGGPAADDLEQLDSARSRMTRLADRAGVRADAT